MTDILITEDVWNDTFAREFAHRTVRQLENLWSDQAALLSEVAAARALIVRNRTQVDAGLLAAAKDLEVVGRAGVGLDNIDLAAANDAGVVVVAPLGANAVSVAEHTLGLALALLRSVIAHDRAVRDGHWQRSQGSELSGRNWGIIGAGATGRAVARIAQALGCSVRAYDPHVTSTPDAEMVSLETVLQTSDVLSVHLPSTEQTHNLLGRAEFAQIKPGAILISVGRGEVIDEPALAAALTTGRLGGAALDVRATEPPLPSALDTAPNVIYTPHVAGITVESQQRIAHMLASDINAVLDGRHADHHVGVHALALHPAGR